MTNNYLYFYILKVIFSAEIRTGTDNCSEYLYSNLNRYNINILLIV